MILPWRNHPDVRRFMFTQHEISAEEHTVFFAHALHDPTRSYYLGMEDECSVGVVTFRDIDMDHKTAFWGFYTGPGSPAGAGRRMLTLALDQAFVHLGFAKLSGEAFAYNEASIRLHLKLGFAVEGIMRDHREHGCRRIDVVRMSMLASHWTPEHKNWLNRAGELRPRSEDGAAPIVYRTDARGGLVPLVVNHLVVRIGHVVSLHLDATQTGRHVGAVELALQCVAHANDVATYDVHVRDADSGAAVASGSANVVVAKGAP